MPKENSCPLATPPPIREHHSKTIIHSSMSRRRLIALPLSLLYRLPPAPRPRVSFAIAACALRFLPHRQHARFPECRPAHPLVPRWAAENQPVVDGTKPASGSAAPSTSVVQRSIVIGQAVWCASAV